jgi:SAM-dependent methyltransferase
MMRPGARIALAASLALALASSGCGAGQRFADQSLASDGWQADAVLALLGIDPGDVVVEFGADAGCSTYRFAEAVGETGRVLTIDSERGSFSNLDGVVDLVFVCDAYHRISDPHAFFDRALAAMVPNGRVAIVEQTRGGTPADAIAREMHEAGYERIAKHEILTRQSFQIFRADDGTGE